MWGKIKSSIKNNTQFLSRPTSQMHNNLIKETRRIMSTFKSIQTTLKSVPNWMSTAFNCFWKHYAVVEYNLALKTTHPYKQSSWVTQEIKGTSPNKHKYPSNKFCRNKQVRQRKALTRKKWKTIKLSPDSFKKTSFWNRNVVSYSITHTDDICWLAITADSGCLADIFRILAEH